MHNCPVNSDGVPASGGGVFVRQLIAWLLTMDLLYFTIGAGIILIICLLLRFIIMLKEGN